MQKSLRIFLFSLALSVTGANAQVVSVGHWNDLFGGASFAVTRFSTTEQVLHVSRRGYPARANCGAGFMSAGFILRHPPQLPAGFTSQPQLLLSRHITEASFYASQIISRALPSYPLYVDFLCLSSTNIRGERYVGQARIISVRMPALPGGYVFKLECLPGFTFSSFRFLFVGQPPAGFDLNRTPLLINGMVYSGSQLELNIASNAVPALPEYPFDIHYSCLKRS